MLILLITALQGFFPPPLPDDWTVESEQIQIVRGDPTKLSRLKETLGDRWKGGLWLYDDPTSQASVYWLFSWQTNAQAATFDKAVSAENLSGTSHAYVQGAMYPDGRKTLDEIADTCGTSHAALWLHPNNTVGMGMEVVPMSPTFKCITSELRDSPWGPKAPDDMEVEVRPHRGER